MVLNVIKRSSKGMLWMVHWPSKMEITEHLHKSNFSGKMEVKL